MDRILLALCVIVLVSSSCLELSGQKTLAETKNMRVSSHAFNDDREGGDELIFAVIEKGVITSQPMRGGSKNFRFYNSNLKFSHSEELSDNQILPGKMELAQVFKVGQEIYGLAFHTDESEMLNEVYLLEFDPSEFRFRSDYRTISSVVGNDYFKNFLNAFLDIEVSTDESKVLVSHKLPERDGFISFRTLVFGADMTLTDEYDLEFEHKNAPFFLKGSSWTSHKSIPYTFGTSSNSPFEIDSQGTLYSYGHIKGDSENWYICIIDRGRPRYLEIEEDSDFEVYGMGLQSPKNTSDVWFVAKYEDKPKEEVGFLFQKLNAKGAGEITLISWDNQTVGDYLQKSQKKIQKFNDKGKKFQPNNADLIAWYQLADESLLLVMERNFSVTTTDSKGNTRTTYYSQNILVSRIDSNGVLSESTVIRKNQASGNYRYQGSFVMLENDMLHILFNDHPSNAGAGWDGLEARRIKTGNGAVALIEIDARDLGFTTRSHLWTTKENQNIPITPEIRALYEFQSGKYITWCNAGARRNMVLFEFD